MCPQGTAPAPRAERKLATYRATDKGKNKSGFASTDADAAARVTYYTHSAIRPDEKSPNHTHQITLARRNVSNPDGSPALDSCAVVVNSVKNNQVVGRTSTYDISAGQFNNGNTNLKDSGVTIVDMKILYNDGENQEATHMRVYHKNPIIRKVEFWKKN